MGNVTKLSQLFVRTLRDNPSYADVESHRLLLRAAYIRQVAPGIFSWLPLGLKVLQKIEAIVREEMEKIGGQELYFPALLPREPYEVTKRWDEYGANIFRLNDRHGGDYLLAPTHEEMFALIVKDMFNSYKDLPVQLFQIQTKYRDEARPRAGLLRGREFIMKDAYSFDLTDDGLHDSYQLYRGAYQNIFTRLELPYVIVKAQSGAMGGSASEEFLSPAPIGEDTYVIAPSGYAANVEAAEVLAPADLDADEIAKLPPANKLKTPGLKSVVDVANFAKTTPKNLLKAVYLTLEHPALNDKKAHCEVIVVCVPGNRELDEKRVEAIFAPAEVRQTTPEDLANCPELVPGFVGPNDEIAKSVRYFFDTSINIGSNWVTGGNEIDMHIQNNVAGRDFQIGEHQRIGAVQVIDGDQAADGSGAFEIERGIEVGHIFALGRKYTEAFDLKVLDENGKAVTPTMGSYGIGVTRVLALIAENHRDDKGLAWPKQVAPADVQIVIASKDESDLVLATKHAEILAQNGLDVFLDDRNTSPGVKFKDAELIGVPLTIIFGRGLKEVAPTAEVKRRNGDNRQDVPLDMLTETVLNFSV